MVEAECSICTESGIGLVCIRIHELPPKLEYVHPTCLRKRLKDDKTTLGRFFSKTILGPKRKRGQCILWKAGKTTDGYGRFSLHNRTVRAHRYILAKLTGVIPFEVLHLCDTPACVNIAHLSGGNKYQNMQDMARKGRGRNQYGPYKARR